MAASFGATTLAEVHHEGLDQLLHELANVYPTSADRQLEPLGVPVLDALLKIFMMRMWDSSNSSGYLQSANTMLQQEQILTEDEEMLLQGDNSDWDNMVTEAPAQMVDSEPSNIFFSGAAARSKLLSPVIEISSSLSGAGKSQLLYYLTARAILPQYYGNVHVSGRESAVVWIDTDDRFNADRLRSVAHGILKPDRESSDDDNTEPSDVDSTELSEEDIGMILASSLQHVHVFRPQSSSALLATLYGLDSYLYDLKRHFSASRPLHMIAIDSATAFLWQDKLRDEVARTEDIGRPRAEVDEERERKQSFYFSDIYAELVNELKRLQSLFGCSVVYTTTVSGGRPSAMDTGASGPLDSYDRGPSQKPSLRPALPAPWGAFPVLRIVVHRDTVRPFPPAISAHDSRKDAPSRQKIVRQGKFSAWVNSWGREEWPRRVVDGINAHNGGCFSFYVRETGVQIPYLGGQ
ncbi:hypothetical protein N7462_002180 [Penicillium macrosclerotiorum]|uniref:uncharacterized protein n=1 Tax=Penicillium macrosclerotiorum TaxID=303699 RepID=UPI002547F648|nr:uncharacterized protein N7462_002180 [Penicillium macrosclerotiorum]KAJ5692757.1 hypothetical protein N7462_002180 [Penicillium macrosclerotiorum]